MTTVIIIVAVLFILFVLPNITEKKGNEKKTSSKRPTKDYAESNKGEVETNEPIPTVADLVKGVNTIEDVKRFIKKQNKVDDGLNNYDTDKEYNRNVKLCSRYQDAFSELDRKILFYQYVPDIDLETNSSDLAHAFRIYSLQEYKLNKGKLNKGCWNEIYALDLSDFDKVEDAGEPKPDYFEALLEFRKVVESEFPLQEKHIAIIEIVKNNDSFKKQFFDSNDDLVVNRCLFWLLESYKIPLLDKLVNLGFNTPDKLTDISEEQLQTINGFGSSRIEQFKTAIKRINKI